MLGVENLNCTAELLMDERLPLLIILLPFCVHL
jgi:hypothetical protein